MTKFQRAKGFIFWGILVLVVGIGTAWAVNPSGPGQTTAAKSLSVVIASDQTVPVSGTLSVSAVDGGATAALQTTGNTSLSTIATNLPAKGSTTMSGSTPITIATNDTVAAALQVALNLLTQPKSTVAVTPSDSTDLTGTCTKGLWVGTAGNLSVKRASDSSAVTEKNVPSGSYVPGNFIRVMAATTATDIVCWGGTG